MAMKKVEPIKSLGRAKEGKLTVQKSLPLFSLWRSDLTLAEFKILDIYLSRIDSHKPERRVVVFDKEELEKILDVKKINNVNLKERLKHLMENVVDISDGDEKRGFRLISLFEEAVAEQDEYGVWQVRLECTQKAMKYIFDIENLGYLRYKLRCITSISSRYTYIMFIYLESNRFRKSWEVSLGELKTILNCDKEEYAQEFKYFNRDILKKIQKEMHEKTECKYSYEIVKRGRTVVAIRFTLETLPKVVIEDFQYTIDEWQKDEDRKKRNDICNGFASEEFDSFTDGELEYLKELAWSKKDDERVRRHNEAIGDFILACEFATSDYLRLKIKMARMKKPKNLFLYLKKMIENE